MSAVGSILTNQGALDALQSINTTSSLNNTLENELSTGLAITSPASNPAGFITAQGFTSQLNGLTQAVSNANQGVSLLQTAQGALQQQIGIVQQLNSISVQAANGTETSQEATSLQNVVSQLTGQVNAISSQTQFNNVSLLNGTFNNVQFQVGANEGQTVSLSIGNTSASSLGAFQTAAVASKQNAAETASAAAKGSGGAASAFRITVGGNSLGSVTPTSTLESAAGLAAQVNSLDGAKGVTASASNVVNLGKFTAGTGQVTLTLAASGSGKTIGTGVQATGSSLTSLIANINKGTSETGISAAQNSSGSLILTQGNANNIQVSGFSTSGTATVASVAGATGTGSTGQVITVQGSVQLAGGSQISVTNSTGTAAPAALVGATSTFFSLADVNVSTVNGTPSGTTGVDLNTQGGANQAISVVNFALQSLNNTGGQLGAVQQGLAANINNLDTTSENVTTALGVVQDANLPQVANQLTQAQIQAQAGVAALKSSTTLQQSFLSLLP
ncbi:MAG TPA: flagellin [Acidocella sp.]|uniref:flagellin N-terminal helical domain-containing protein n=1 Tax=Acidocella sp. TaxID=50710 RepID=UPI002BB958BD|nr:flagellin [Acidocella sp.]HVE22007.1 flagellin [Acidocella sp.]